MPPRKRQRLSPPEEPAGRSAKQNGSGAPTADELVKDPWSDEQNTALMKGLIKWKPVGMHKHFRMLSLANYLHTHGHEAEHTRIPGIWKKLSTLYNMKTLDEREDSYGDSLLRGSSEDRSTTASSSSRATSGGDEEEGDEDEDEENEDGAAKGKRGAGDGGGSTASNGRRRRRRAPYFAFQLPEDRDLRAHAFDRRLAAERPGSPPALRYQLATAEAEPGIAHSFPLLDNEAFMMEQRRRPVAASRDSTPATPAPTTTGAGRGRAGGRGGRGMSRADANARKGMGRAKEEQQASAPSKRGRGQRGRPPRKEVEVEVEVEDSDEDDDDEDDEADEEQGSGEESSGEEEEEESEKEAPKTRGGMRGKGRGRGGARGRGRRGR